MTSRHHSLDHRAAIALLRLGSKRKLASYHKTRQKFLLQSIIPLIRGEHLYEALQEKCKPSPPHERPSNSWIRGGTDHRTVIALLRLGSKRKLALYCKKQHKFLLQPILPLTRGEHLYEAL